MLGPAHARSALRHTPSTLEPRLQSAAPHLRKGSLMLLRVCIVLLHQDREPEAPLRLRLAVRAQSVRVLAVLVRVVAGHPVWPLLGLGCQRHCLSRRAKDKCQHRVFGSVVSASMHKDPAWSDLSSPLALGAAVCDLADVLLAHVGGPAHVQHRGLALEPDDGCPAPLEESELLVHATRNVLRSERKTPQAKASNAGFAAAPCME
eukprot:3586263-Rhodomonas_salina.3